MRKITLTRDQFTVFAFPAVAQAPAETESELETAMRLIRKFKDTALTDEIPLTDKEIAEGKADPRKKQYTFRTLREASATFILEEDERKLLLKRVEGNKLGVSTLVLEEYMDMIAVVKDAPEALGVEKA